MTIRKAKPCDIELIRGVVEREIERYNEIEPMWTRIYDVIGRAISSPPGFALVSQEGTLTGAMIAWSADSYWAAKQTATVLLWSTQVKGDGIAMMRQFKEWVTQRRAIRHVEMAISLDTDPRIRLLLKRLGFNPTDTVFRNFELR